MCPTNRRIALFFCFTLSLAVLSNIALAQTITVLHGFTAGEDGAYPTGLTMDRAGNLYGTTWDGGIGRGEFGVVFRLAREGSGWVLTPLHEFLGEPSDGSNPSSRVIIGPDGSLYGTTVSGGQYGEGTVYRLRPQARACASFSCPWEETILYSFCSQLYCTDGKIPAPGALVFDQAGNLYGTTVFGGSAASPTNPGDGTVFELTPSNGGWTHSVLWSFTESSQGSGPYGSVIFDNAGNLYGTTGYDGANASGTVYELSPSASGWTEQTLASINFDRAYTYAGLVMDGQGNLFGASGCGNSEAGGVFELSPSNGNWTFNVLHTWAPTNEGPCSTLTLDAAGNLRGTSSWTGLYNDGEVFQLTPSSGGWIYTSVSFDGSNGEDLVGSVILDDAGNIYGTAYLSTQSAGNVWEITP